MSDKKVEDLTLLTLLPVDKLLAALDVESATLWGLHHAPLQVVYGSVHAWNRRPSNRVHHLHLGINLLAVLIARDELYGHICKWAWDMGLGAECPRIHLFPLSNHKPQNRHHTN